MRWDLYWAQQKERDEIDAIQDYRRWKKAV
jgi:hypothetical protein